jgi:hypothetical protein
MTLTRKGILIVAALVFAEACSEAIARLYLLSYRFRSLAWDSLENHGYEGAVFRYGNDDRAERLRYQSQCLRYMTYTSDPFVSQQSYHHV